MLLLNLANNEPFTPFFLSFKSSKRWCGNKSYMFKFQLTSFIPKKSLACLKTFQFLEWVKREEIAKIRINFSSKGFWCKISLCHGYSFIDFYMIYRTFAIEGAQVDFFLREFWSFVRFKLFLYWKEIASRASRWADYPESKRFIEDTFLCSL